MYVNRNIIIPISLRDKCRELVAVATSEEIANGMWITELSSTGESPSTHAISAGPTASELAFLLPLKAYGEEDEVNVTGGDVDALFEVTGAAREELETLFSLVEITDEDPWVSLERMGLKIVNKEDDGKA